MDKYSSRYKCKHTITHLLTVFNTCLHIFTHMVTWRIKPSYVWLWSNVWINEEIKDKKNLEKILLCDVQNEIYPNLEKTFLNLLHNSGYPGIKLDKKIDFTQLYKQKSN